MATSIVAGTSKNTSLNRAVIMSVSPNESIHGTRLHQTVREKHWWVKTFAELGLTQLEPFVRYFNTHCSRPEVLRAGSFHLS